MRQINQKITTLLSKISSIPDLLGQFIYIEQEGLILSNLPAWCPDSEMEKTGRLVHDLFSKNSIFNRQQKNITITFESILILAIRLDDRASLVCVCLSTIDPDSFETSSGDIIEELKKAIPILTVGMENNAPEEELFFEDLDAGKTVFGQVANDVKEVNTVEEASLSKNESAELTIKVLLPIERALTKVIGPASEILMADTVKTWKQTGEPSTDRMNELVELLCQGIRDKKQENKFRDIIRPRMPSKKSNPSELKRIEKALARTIGPASAIIIEEIMKKWHPDNLSSSNQLNKLVDLLCIEINDPEKEGKFRDMVNFGPTA